jgi:hypothetical protein
MLAGFAAFSQSHPVSARKMHFIDHTRRSGNENPVQLASASMPFGNQSDVLEHPREPVFPQQYRQHGRWVSIVAAYHTSGYIRRARRLIHFDL